jgi:hypothetical protein
MDDCNMDDSTDATMLDPRIAAMTFRDLQAKCKEYGIPAKGTAEVLRRNLNDYKNNPRETLKRLAREKMKAKGFIDWKKSAAREILLADLEPPKGWLYGLDNLAAQDVYDYYIARYEEEGFFQEVPFSQFEKRYDEAIKTAAKRRARSAEEEEMLKHDRLLHPRQTHNNRGEPVFDLDQEAKAHLSDDIKNNLHKQMKPEDLWLSREVYQKYRLNKFRQRIYQYIVDV